ncbi:hypothetical protein GJAV_G00018050 [Gymnothorax javanicus]|nr:hypothetical protein GJAV_G00018050 [Gymnothorax javanicus]
MSRPDPTGRLARWCLRLQEFDFHIIYKPGKAYNIPDALSRNPVEGGDDVTDLLLGHAILNLLNLRQQPMVALEDREQLRQLQQEDPVIGRLLTSLEEDPALDEPEGSKFGVRGGIVYFRDPKTVCRLHPDKCLRVYLPCQLRPSSLDYFHDHPIAGHLGVTKTLQRLQRKPSGLLVPIVATHPWEYAGVDFVGSLPRTAQEKVHILVFVDYFTKWVEISSVREATAAAAANMFMKDIVARYGTPEYLISDRGTPFVSRVFDALLQRLGTEHHLTTTYHPQTNMTERVNRTLKTAIRTFVGNLHRSWDKFIPHLSLALRTAPHASTGDSPAFLLYGRDLKTPLDPILPLETEELSSSMGEYKADLVKILKDAHNHAQECLLGSHAKQKENYDRGREHVAYQVNDLVKVRSHPRSDADAGFAAKLAPVFRGPYRVVECLSEVNYHLMSLLDGSDAGVFHVVDMRPFFTWETATQGRNTTPETASAVSLDESLLGTENDVSGEESILWSTLPYAPEGDEGEQLASQEGCTEAWTHSVSSNEILEQESGAEIAVSGDTGGHCGPHSQRGPSISLSATPEGGLNITVLPQQGTSTDSAPPGDRTHTTAQAETGKVKNLLNRIVNQLNVGSEAHRVGLAQFNSDTKVEFLLNKYRTKDEVLLHLKNQFRLRGGRDRQVGRALENARVSFFNTAAGSRIAEGAKQFLVVITAGESEDSVIRAARSLKTEGTTIISIGLPKTKKQELQLIATSPYVFQMSPQTTASIPQEVKRIVESKEARHALETGPSDCRSAKMADIVFIVDQSGSMQAKYFQVVRKFIYRIVDGLDVGLKKVRVGIVLYGDTASALVYLNSIREKGDILQFIKVLPYKAGGTNTGAALNFTRENMFTKSTGSRRDQGVQQLAILITNRKSQDDVSKAAVALRRSGVTVYAVGVQDADSNELKKIASHPPRNFVFKADSLVKLEKSLQKLLCFNIIQRAFAAPARSFSLKTGCVQTGEADFYFLIDHSGSIYPNDFEDMKKFIQEFLDMFRIGSANVRVGMVKFADDPTLEFTLTEHIGRLSLEIAVDDVRQVGGGTEIGKALTFMAPLFKDAATTRGEEVPQYLVIITDGKSSDVVDQPAKELRDQGVTIYAIGVRGADEDELLQISGAPEKKFFVNDFDALKPIKDEIVTDICSGDVCKDMDGDVLFLIDGSSSIGPSDFIQMKQFIMSIVDKSAVGLDKLHVGVLQFSVKQREEFPLNKFYDQGSINQAISSIQQLDGGTLTGAALSFASKYFDSPKGGRLNVRQFLIVITDGEAQDDVSKPAQELRNKGVFIYSIGVLNANSSQLLEISGSQDRVFTERDFNALQHLEKSILFKLCYPETVCKKTEVADMIFLVDGSSSIVPTDFQSIRKFMTSMVNNTDVGENRTRFGAIVYSDEPKISFTLNQYYNKKEVRKAIANVEQPGGDTYTARGLTYSLDYFEPQYGGRAAADIPQILIVITDGEASDSKDLRMSAGAVRQKGIKVYSVGVGGADIRELEIMAGDSTKVFYVDSYEALEVLHKNISSMLCVETKPVCDKEKADLVILMDGSNSIGEVEFKIMKKFVSDVAGSFKVSPENVRIGMAQFSTDPHKMFYLNEYENITDVKNSILEIEQIGGGTYIGKALYFIQEFFKASTGSRIAQKVSQNLVVITDGESLDDVEHAAEALRSMNINVFVIGVGRIHAFELLQIAGSQDRFFTAENFAGLEKIKDNVVDTICTPPRDRPSTECSVDIGIGFDVSQRTRAGLLFSSQQKLKSYFPEIISYISSLDDLCCTEGKKIKPNIGFLVAGKDGQIINDYEFESYKEEVVQKVMALQSSEPTFLNVQLLKAFSSKFKKQSRAAVKVLIIFTDGFDDIVEQLEAESDDLRREGIRALLLVGLEGVRNPKDLQMVEFGRGFGYKEPLSIGMQDVASVMLKQIDTVVGRECCGVLCKCFGQEGVRGPRGPPGRKGQPGSKGHPGFPGEEGGMGERGPPGLNGTQGLQGCLGKRGIKGSRGYRGNRGEDGDHGLDGVHGEQGLTGSPGRAGERGNPGSAGRRGIQGEPGIRGEPGLRGDPGEPGEDNTIPGPQGGSGNPGIQGDAGADGPPGENGAPGNTGAEGRRGSPGDKGEKGAPGEPGLLGSPGPTGPQGVQGPRGLPGPVGALGLPGPQGKPGPAGDKGSTGGRGFKGQKGQQGDVGAKGAPGPLGPRGMPGLDGTDGYGSPGPKGLKGEPGFPGYPGLQGEDGLKGDSGGPGPKGNRGRRGNSGRPGPIGEPGASGPPGHGGPRGSPGIRTMSACQLVNYVRDNCVCSLGKAECPAYPTELVIALDMSEDVSPQIFERMRTVALTLLEDISIAESNCPTGARVAVLSYSSNTKYLIRFSDYHRKHHLIEAVKNIPLERTSNRRNIGAAMRFVARNVFKRVRQGVLMRKVAVFITNGPSQDMTQITTAMLEFKALDVSPAVIAFKNAPNVRRAFEADESKSFLLTVMGRPQDLRSDLRQVQQCVICYDPCSPAEACRGINLVPVPVELDVDLALVVDSSRNVQSDQFEGVRQVLGSVLDQIVVSTQPGRPNNQARVALVQHSTSSYPPREGQDPAKVEFDLLGYKDRNEMKAHVFQLMQQIGGASGLGHAIEWTIQNVMLKAANPRKTKIVLAIVGGETSDWDRAKLDTIALQAKCMGVVVFILTVGGEFSYAQVEELASVPLEQHIIHLGRMKQGEQEYAQRFLRSFLHMVKRGINTYPSATLRRQCANVQMLTAQGEALVGMRIDRYPLDDKDLQYIDQTEEPLAEVPTTEKSDRELSPGRGDENGFSTHSAQCDLDMDRGTFCDNYVRRWYFNKTISACSPFWYGGCAGNKNRFNTEDECFHACGSYSPAALQRAEDLVQLSQVVCSQRQDEGSCQNYTLKWYFDKEQNECSRFWFGGCGGNDNRFETQDACEALCQNLQ